MNWLHWALLSALFAGLTAVLAKAGVKGIDSNLATAIRTVVILVFAWSIALFRGFDTLSKATTRTWLFLILSGLATGASWLCYFRALQAGPASRVAPIDKLSVALVILLAALFLGERLTWSKGVGGLLIVHKSSLPKERAVGACQDCGNRKDVEVQGFGGFHFSEIGAKVTCSNSALGKGSNVKAMRRMAKFLTALIHLAPPTDPAGGVVLLECSHSG